MGFIILKSVWAISLVVPQQGNVIGEVQYANPEVGETLSEMGIRYDIGYYEMLRANPKIDPTSPLNEGMTIIIPSQFILPNIPHEGIVINLAEYRLYYFPPNDNVVLTMPVGIGREGWTTPVGLTHVTAKERDPIWRPTTKVQMEASKHGEPIPGEFPPGEGNPLGRHVLRLGWATYLIHGTNRRDGIGSRVSAGCIRMMPEDIEYLYNLVPVGTPVRVVNEPIKFGYLDGKIYVQIHPPLIEQKKRNFNTLINKQLQKLSIKNVNNKILEEELKFPSGIPRKIS